LCGIRVHGTSYIEAGTIILEGNVELEAYTYIGRYVFIDDQAKVTIHDNARIGAHSRILTRTHPVEASVVRRQAGKNIDIPLTIGRGCWIATGVTIMPGASIAEGCVIGAGAVVTRPTAPNGLYVGSPARRIKDLPTDNDAALSGQ